MKDFVKNPVTIITFLVCLTVMAFIIFAAADVKASVIQDQSEYQWKVWTCPDTQSDIEKTLKEMGKWLKENNIKEYEWHTCAGYQYHLTIRYKK